MNPIQSVKKQQSTQLTYAGADANQIVTISNGVAVGAATTTTNVPVGAKISSINVSVNYINSSASLNTTLEWFMWKGHDNQLVSTSFAATSAANWTNIGLSNSRNQIIKSYQSVSPPSIGGMYKHNEQIQIPKMFQRVREGDFIQISFNATQAGLLSIGSRFKYYM